MVVFWRWRRGHCSSGDVVEDGVQVVQDPELLCDLHGSFQRNPRTLILTIAPLDLFVDACLDVFLQDSCPLGLGKVGHLQDVGGVDPPVLFPAHHGGLWVDELVHGDARVRCRVEVFMHRACVDLYLCVCKSRRRSGSGA